MGEIGLGVSGRLSANATGLVLQFRDWLVTTLRSPVVAAQGCPGQ
jgi:hypothetical protein